MKKDSSIRNICVAAIKRHSFKPIKFPLTRLYETESLSEVYTEIMKVVRGMDNELPICQTFIDSSNWTLVTTKRIISSVNKEIQETCADKVTSWHWEDFKGIGKNEVSIGKIELEDKRNMKIYLETGNGSMVTIYAIMTLVGQLKS
jgi:hypothetical protein